MGVFSGRKSGRAGALCRVVFGVSFWSSRGRILSSLGKAWRTRGAPRARSAKRSDRGELSASGEVPEPEEVRASAALVGCSRRGACLRCVGWPASVRVVCGEVEGGRRTMIRTATAQGCRVSVCMVVPVSHGHIAGPDAVPTISRGRAGGRGCPRRGGWVGDGERRRDSGRRGSPTMRLHSVFRRHRTG